MKNIILTILILILTINLSAESKTNNNHEIYINDIIQIRQGLNQCGPASAMAIINAYTDEIIPLERINNDMGNRLGNNMTYPWGITNYLESQGIKSKYKILKLKTDKSKLEYLKKKLLENKPIIMLNDMDGILHYFTLLGFNENNDFYIYDSMQPLDKSSTNRRTIDSNGSKPGNITIDKETLFKRWKDAKYKFINYLVIIPNDGIEEL